MRLTLAILLCSLTANAANFFITPAGAGSHNGSSWNQAFAGTAGINWSALSPGDTMWVAGGNYGAFFWGKSGTQASPISFKRATASNAECTSSPGWQAGFDSQVGIYIGDWGPWSSGLLIQNYDGVTLDGQVPNGIRFTIAASTQNPATGPTDVHFGIYGGGNYATFRYIDFEGPNTEFSAYGINWGGYQYSGNPHQVGLTISHCRIYGVNTALFINMVDNLSIEYTDIINLKGNNYNHTNGAFINNCNYGVFRYCQFLNSYTIGIFFSGTFGPGSNHWKIYGNVWSNPPELLSGTAISFDNAGQDNQPFQLGSDWQFYNNTISHWAIGFRTDSRYPQYSSSVTGGQAYNNLFYQTSFQPGLMAHDYNWSSSAISGAAEAHGIVSASVPFVGYPNNLQIVTNISSALPRAKGTPLAAEFQTSINGLNWGVGDWDMGAYKATTGGAPPGNPGVITLSASTASAVEGNSITITAMRTGGSLGAVGCSYATANGTALSGVNYTSASGSFSWADGDAANKTVTVTTANVGFVGTKVFAFNISTPTGGATLGAITTDTITLTGTGTPVLAGLSWQAEAGVYAAPWTLATAGGVTYIYPTVETDPQALSGVASYTFTCPSNGVYRVKAVTSSETTGNNSVWIDMNNAHPSDPTAIWDMPVTGLGVWTNTYVSWRGTNGTPFVAQYPGKTWTLTAGQNTLYVLSREAGAKFDSITVEGATNPVVDVTVANVSNVLAPSGYFPAGSNVVITVGFSAPATVTSGTPALTLNNGKTATYTSGSGTTNLVFTYTTAVGDDTQSLSYAATNSLAGDIRDGGGNAFDLTLPAPGAVGSMTYNAAVVVDTVAPAVVIGPPTSARVTSGGAASYAVTYSDLNFGQMLLGNTNMTLHVTGTATGQINVQPFIPSNSIALVTISGVSGSGTIGFSFAGGTATDKAGNLAPPAVSTEFAVNKPNVIFRNVILRDIRVP